MPKLSFICPIYKKNHILERCIKSFQQQSLTDWEAIFVLDGKDDIAKEIIHRLMKKKPNHYKVLEIEHGGACAARNFGFDASKGEYVIFWDADSLIEPHAAKAWVDIFESSPEIQFVYSGYKFLNEQGAINAEPWDPWLLKIRNFISTMNPVRRSASMRWDENIKSLQDWDFWLSVVAKAQSEGKDINKIAKHLKGHSFSTEASGEDTISGQGCKPEIWLERVGAVKLKHGLKDKETCVSSLSYKQDGIALAKLIDADYQDYPNFKPHEWKNIIQIGFSLKPDQVEAHSSIFRDPDVKKFLFWTPDNISEVYNEISLSAVHKYSILLNSLCTQFVEDKVAKDMMEKAGFHVKTMPLPMLNTLEVQPLPKKPKWAVDCDPQYGKIFSILDKSLPDIDMEVLTGMHGINDYTGLVHYYADKTLSSSIKRMILTGRHVISNVKAPYAGFLDDNQEPEKFMATFVDTIRQLSTKEFPKQALEYYGSELGKERLMEALCA